MNSGGLPFGSLAGKDLVTGAAAGGFTPGVSVVDGSGSLGAGVPDGGFPDGLDEPSGAVSAHPAASAATTAVAAISRCRLSMPRPRPGQFPRTVLVSRPPSYTY
ncbi:hypothetical protein GCM10028799_04810 [Kribbella italica]